VAKHSRALLLIHDALVQRGFRRHSQLWGSPVYRGRLDPTSLNVPISISITDLDFINPPLISIGEEYPIGGRTLPHILGIGRAVCYYAKGSVVLDRYNPAGTVVQCLERAERVIRDAIRGRSDNDFAAEFQSYWSSSFTLVDVPEGYTGAARIRYVNLDESGEPTPVLSNGASWLLQRDRRSRVSADDGEPALVINTKEPLSLNPHGAWPPTTLAQLNDWLRWVAPELVGRLEGVMRSGSKAVACVAVRAPNGVFIYRAVLPTRFQKSEFLENRRSAVHRLMTRVSAEVEVDRAEGVCATVDYVFGRNMGASKNLTGKRILLIGCGTIGSFLAQQLAQSGAGAGTGFLSLVDSDILKPANLGRHLLGVPYLHRNKAEGCAAFLQEQLPPLAIEAHSGDVLGLTLPWDRYDLIVDATGEEALSIALNERAVSARPNVPAHVFVWLVGNGALAQCILTGEAQRACLKCLKANLTGEPRFRSMRPGVEVETIADAGCSANYTPFPVSRSVAASALACDLILDWANDAPGDRFRSLTLDPRRAFQVRSGSPASVDRCPACGGV
jgi:molybdopterin/thiamine biosynthesis adenylyltransferase